MGEVAPIYQEKTSVDIEISAFKLDLMMEAAKAGCTLEECCSWAEVPYVLVNEDLKKELEKLMSRPKIMAKFNILKCLEDNKNPHNVDISWKILERTVPEYKAKGDANPNGIINNEIMIKNLQNMFGYAEVVSKKEAPLISDNSNGGKSA